MSIRNALLVAGMFAVSTASARAEEFSKRNTIIIDQPIVSDTMAPVMDKMNKFLVQKKVPSEINLIIDSPGGSVYTGFKFIVQMKALQAQGTVIKCYVPGLAASMAFHILLHCDERTVLQESALLWHRARVFIMMGVVTAPTASELARDLYQIDSHILREVRAGLSQDMSDKEILYHFERETLHIGRDLCNKVPNFCTAKAAVPGLVEAIAKQGMVHTLPVDAKFSGKESMVYIYLQYLLDIVNK
jgi:ATP-dependent protease ClpP protease subunit